MLSGGFELNRVVRKVRFFSYFCFLSFLLSSISVAYLYVFPVDNVMYYSQVNEMSFDSYFQTHKPLGLFVLWWGEEYWASLFIHVFLCVFFLLCYFKIHYQLVLLSIVTSFIFFQDASFLWMLSAIPPQGVASVFLLALWFRFRPELLVFSFFSHPLYSVFFVLGGGISVLRFNKKEVLFFLGFLFFLISAFFIFKGWFPREVKAFFDYTAPSHGTYYIGKKHALVIICMLCVILGLKIFRGFNSSIFSGVVVLFLYSLFSFFWGGIFIYRAFPVLGFVFFMFLFEYIFKYINCKFGC